MPNVPAAGFDQAAGFSTKSLFGSMQWQFRSLRKSGCPGTRFMNVPDAEVEEFWPEEIEVLLLWNNSSCRLFCPIGDSIGSPLE